jgi:tight adherence protein C
VIAVLSAGALVGLGLFLVGRALFPPRPSLAVVLARVNGGGAEPVATLAGGGRWSARVGPPLARALERAGIHLGELAPDLAVLGRSVEEHMARRAAGAAFGVGVVAGVGCLAALVGLSLSLLTVAWLAAGAALVGFVVPDTLARRQALVRRAAFRQALAFFLDLVIVVLAGGAGVSSGLRQASEAGDGWAYTQIRGALARGRIRREPPWVVLGQLGAELGITELEELAAAVSLAEREGASVRQSLTAKAASIRDHQLADVEAAASSATVRMAAPLVLLGLGFCGFILYGAVTSVFVGA